jgi:hypothetical protein
MPYEKISYICVGMLMICLRTELHMRNTNWCIVVTINSNSKANVCTAAMLFCILQVQIQIVQYVYYRNKGCVIMDHFTA